MYWNANELGVYISLYMLYYDVYNTTGSIYMYVKVPKESWVQQLLWLLTTHQVIMSGPTVHMVHVLKISKWCMASFRETVKLILTHA